MSQMTLHIQNSPTFNPWHLTRMIEYINKEDNISDEEEKNESIKINLKF